MQEASELVDGDRRDWQRHPVDVARLGFRVCILLLVLGLTAAFPSALTNLSADLVRSLARAPVPLRYSLVGAAQLAAVVIPVVVLVWLLRQRTRAATLLVVGAAIAGGLVMVVLTDWLERVAPPAEITDLPSSSFLDSGFPSASYLAALVAGAAAAAPMMPLAWRRVAWGAVIVTALVRVLSATQAPVGIVVTLALGSVIGSIALVVVGTPQRRPGSATLRAALASGGFDIDELVEHPDRRDRRSYRGVADGAAVDIVYLDRDDRDIELFGRVVRAVRVRDVDEQRLSVQPRVRATQISTSTTMAERAGASVPAVLAVVPSDDDSAVIVTSHPVGSRLADLTADEVNDPTLDEIWRQVGRLHDRRLAHRSLAADRIVLDGDSVTLLGMDTVLLASTASSRAVDRAELLVTTALVVGVDRALDSAVRAVEPRRLEEALPFVQMPALPVQARRAMKAQGEKDLVGDLRNGLQERLGVADVELAELERVSVAKIVSWVGFAVLAFFLLTLVTNFSDIREAMSGIDGLWVLPIVIATLLGTVGGAMALSGSVIRPVPLGEATIVMFGQSFLNRFTPMNAGGMAMRIRYLQKGGTDGTVATAAIGLTSAASGVMQVLFIVFFFLWSSSDPTSGLNLSDRDGGPDVSLIAVFVGAIVVAGLVIGLTPKLRRWVVAFVRSTFDKIRHDFGELARRPTKLMLLFGGSGFSKLTTIVAFAFACRAFGVDLAFAELGALYLAANTVASAVPTPGGVGAVEAALVFVLTNAGVDDATAWASMLLFRLINYWFPTIPGYLALRVSERRGLV